MKRREFITLLSSAAAWPLTARAQQVERIRRIGVLAGGYAEIDSEGQTRIAVFLNTLRRLGWIDQRNLQVEVAGG